MSIIQTIRDKGSWVIVSLLALALISFIFSDAGKNFGNGGSNNPTIGTINGSKVKLDDYYKITNAISTAYEGQSISKDQIDNFVWSQFTDYNAMKAELTPLAIDFNDDILADIAIGKYGQANQIVTQLFKKFGGEGYVNPQTNQLNTPEAEKLVKQLKNSKSNNDDANKFLLAFNNMLPLVKMQYLQNKYNLLLQTTNYVPAWQVAKQTEDDSKLINVSLVHYPYNELQDSTIAELKLTDADITTFINKNSSRFKVKETRSIDYTSFSFNPTGADSALVRNSIEEKRAKFDKVNDTTVNLFIDNNSTTRYNNNYTRRKEVQINDSSLTLVKGNFIGPYVQGNSMILAKVMNVKNYADTVNFRHILILTRNPQTGEILLSDSAAKVRIDSIYTAYKGGASFDSLAKKLSQDPSSSDSGGMVKNIAYNQPLFSDEFQDFAFNSASGTTNVIKTGLGYHLVKAESTKGSSKPAYKVAYLTKDIVPSGTTTDSVNNVASNFAGKYNDAKAFDAYFTANTNPTQLKLNAYNIDRNSLRVQGLEDDVKELCKWAFEADVNQVSKPFLLNKTYKYVVAKLVSKQDEGMQTAESLRKSNSGILEQLKNEKKFTYLSKKFGTVTSIEDAATKTGKQLQVRDSVSYQAGVLKDISPEARVVGTAFNTALQNKVSGAIKGTTGLFYIKPTSATYTNNAAVDIKATQKTMEQDQRQQVGQNAMQAFKNKATITDKRLENNL